MFIKELFMQITNGVAGRPLKPPDQAGPKGQQPLSNSDAEASEKKVIRKFLYKY